MRELRPCRKCGRKPVFIPYEESMDGNSDKPAGDAAADAWNAEQGDAPATDDERRRVAVELRELSWCAVTSDSTYDCLASVLHVGRSDFSDEVFARLADLIEPNEPEVKCVAEIKIDGERLEQLVHGTAVKLTGIDREALLALAVNLDERATELLKVNGLDQSRQRRSARLGHATDLMAACSRIREALGEAV